MPEGIFEHPLSVPILMVCHRTYFSGSSCKSPVKYLMDIVYKQADNGGYPFCLYGMKSLKPMHGFVQVKKGTFQLQLGHMHTSVLISEYKMFFCPKLRVETNVHRAARNVQFGCKSG